MVKLRDVIGIINAEFKIYAHDEIHDEEVEIVSDTFDDRIATFMDCPVAMIEPYNDHSVTIQLDVNVEPQPKIYYHIV